MRPGRIDIFVNLNVNIFVRFGRPDPEELAQLGGKHSNELPEAPRESRGTGCDFKAHIEDGLYQSIPRPKCVLQDGLNCLRKNPQGHPRFAWIDPHAFISG